MVTVQLLRQTSGADGTFGNLVLPTGIQLVTGELPWRANAKASSCIPVGEYTCNWTYSNRLGWGYLLAGTGARAGIRIHAANYCGLRSEGKRQEIEGCIALGMEIGFLGSQRAILQSRAAISKFHSVMAQKPFILKIGASYV